MSYGLIKVVEANKLLNDLVVGDCCSGFETGDVWSLKLLESGLIIAFQDMSSTKEASINQALKAADKELFDCADYEQISWATVLASVTRRTIIEASVSQEADLTLIFEGNVSISIRSDADIVDWQWCITNNAPNPYFGEAKLACFSRSSISSWDHV